jgi:hypothetical protein
MATTAQAAGVRPLPVFENANLFELRLGRSSIGYTESNVAGEPVVTYDDGSTTRSFTGAEVRREQTELGVLVTVTLEVIPDLETKLLTLVLPQVLVDSGSPERLTVLVVFSRIESSIAGLPLHAGPVQTYDVKIFDGTASFVVS